MFDTIDRIAHYVMIVALLTAVAGWLLFEVAVARGTGAVGMKKSQPLGPAVLRAGQSVPVSCLNGTLRIEVAAPRLIVATCGNAKTTPLEEGKK